MTYAAINHNAATYLVTTGPQPPRAQIAFMPTENDGRSDRFAAYPADDPYTSQDLAASVLNALGIDPGLEARDAFGRNVPLSTGEVRGTLFG